MERAFAPAPWIRQCLVPIVSHILGGTAWLDGGQSACRNRSCFFFCDITNTHLHCVWAAMQDRSFVDYIFRGSIMPFKGGTVIPGEGGR